MGTIWLDNHFGKGRTLNMELNSLGDYLYQYRAKNKLSVQSLHEITGVSQPYLSQIESGSKTPSRRIIERIARGIANNDEIGIEELHNKLLRLAGYSEIKYFDTSVSLIDKDTASPNSFNIVNDNMATKKKFDYPINDIYFHLKDESNKKMFKNIILDDNDREYVNSMIEIYLLRKYEIKKHDRDNDIKFTDEDFKKIEIDIKNKYFKWDFEKEGD